MRALEGDLTWTFPAIKKQVDSLKIAGVIDIDKSKMKWSITMNPNCSTHIKNIFLHSLQQRVEGLFSVHEFSINKYFLGRVFGKSLDMDVVIIHNNAEKEILDQIKNELELIFGEYFIDTHKISLTTMSVSEREKRYRLADKFVLKILWTIEKK